VPSESREGPPLLNPAAGHPGAAYPVLVRVDRRARGASGRPGIPRGQADEPAER
jgi:hypothetical protein